SHRPSSTEIYPFPYTTLFRSAETEKTLIGSFPGFRFRLNGRDFRGLRLAGIADCLFQIGDEGFLKRFRALTLDDTVRRVGDQNLDRKSTRLNSSHVKISYAVF